MCVPREQRSLRGRVFDPIYSYIESATGLCKFVEDDRFNAAMISRDGRLRSAFDNEQTFSEIWEIVDDVVGTPEMKWVLEEIVDQTMPGGGFQELLISMGLCEKIPRARWTMTSKSNLLFHLGILALDRAHMRGELP